LIAPNKVIKLRESALGRAPIILREKMLQNNLADLYDRVRKDFESIDQFLLTLDVLYILGKIDIDLSTGVVTYAD
jgi:hypothetical protein